MMFKTRSSSVLPTPREQESFLSKIWKNKAELFDAKQRLENYSPLAHQSPKTLNYILKHDCFSPRQSSELYNNLQL